MEQQEDIQDMKSNQSNDKVQAFSLQEALLIMKDAHKQTNENSIKLNMNNSNKEEQQIPKKDLDYDFKIEHQKIFGTTVYIGNIDAQMVFGDFKIYTFQNLITKGYVMAVTHGDINAEILYTRIHSSCVTSESMRSLDCDCVQQLEGALKKIQKQKNGILFYLIQEGRGCGYVGKSRACMIEQYTYGKVDTFSAYNYLGMKKDYREYYAIKDILKMLQINPKFVLMTNNPDKIDAMKSMNLQIIDTAQIEFKPNKFNESYLKAKEKSGHQLLQVASSLRHLNFPFDPIQPFEPYQLVNAPRFVHVSSYYLPVKPVQYRCIVYQDEVKILQEKYGEQVKFTELHNGKFIAQIKDPKEHQYDSVLNQPMWINVNVYYDITSSQDYIVLVYKDIGWENRVPIVRIQSESLLDRFPLKKTEFKNYYKKSLIQIANNGFGIIIIFYHDGKGHGFGNLVLNRNSSKQQQSQTGIDRDVRDYLAASLLLKEKLSADKINEIDLLYSCHYKQEKFSTYIKNQGISIRQMNFIGKEQKLQINGLQELKSKINDTYNHLKYPFTKIENLLSIMEKDSIYYVTGIGSSESHARYLEILMIEHTSYNVKYINIMDIYSQTFKPQGKLILFSQGMSPNTHICFEKYKYSNIIFFTSIGHRNPIPQNSENIKHQIVLKLKKDPSNLIINFPQEDEYECLIRLVGPLCGYFASFNFVSQLSDNLQFVDQKQLNQLEILRQNYLPPIRDDYLQNLSESKSILIISGMNMINYLQNIKYKFQEGMFLNSCEVKSYVELVHGTYQNIEHKKHSEGIITNILILRTANDEYFYTKLMKMLNDEYPIMVIQSNMSESLKIIEYELAINHMLLNYVERNNINQVDWFGKAKQHHLYNIRNFEYYN